MEKRLYGQKNEIRDCEAFAWYRGIYLNYRMKKNYKLQILKWKLWLFLHHSSDRFSLLWVESQKLIPHELMPQKTITLGYCHKKTERIRDKYDDFEGRGAAGGCGAYPFLQKKLPWCDTRRVKFFLSENIYFPVSFDFFLATASLISAEKATLH